MNDIVPYRQSDNNQIVITSKTKFNWNPWYWFERYFIWQFSKLASDVTIVLYGNGEHIKIYKSYSNYYIKLSDTPKIYHWLEEQSKVSNVIIPLSDIDGKKHMIEFSPW